MGEGRRKSRDEEPSEESLQAQLHELNVRSHQYTNRLWQLPFAYAAIAALAISATDQRPLAAVVALLLGVIGIAVLLHIFCGLVDGAQRAVDGIREIEIQLGLKQTAEWKPRWYLYPMGGIVGLISVTELLWAGFLFKAIAN